MENQDTLIQVQRFDSTKVREVERCVFCDSVFLKNNHCEECGRNQRVLDVDSFWNIQEEFYPAGEFLFWRFKLKWHLFWRTQVAREYVTRLKRRTGRLISLVNGDSDEDWSRSLYIMEMQALLHELESKGFLSAQQKYLRDALLPFLGSDPVVSGTQVQPYFRFVLLSFFIAAGISAIFLFLLP